MPNVDDILGEDSSSEAQEQTENLSESWNNPEAEGDFELEEEDSLWDRLMADTPDKELHEYESNPLNITGRDGNKQIIRGLEGLGLESGKAIIDIVMGVIQEVQALDGGK